MLNIEKKQEKLELARAMYGDTHDGKGMAYLASLELGNWLTQGWTWDWFTTQTFADEAIGYGRANASWQAWLNSLRLTCKVKGLGRPYYVRATEYQENRPGRPVHFHALIGGVGDTRRLLFKDMWELDGFARVVKYDPERGAGFYLGKYLCKPGCDLRFSNNLLSRCKEGLTAL